MLYRPKRLCNENITNYREELFWFYQLADPAVWVFWQGYAGQKVNVNAIPWGWGGGGVGTNDWFIIILDIFFKHTL